MERSFWANKALNDAVRGAQERRLELLTPEAFLLFGLCAQGPFADTLNDCGADVEALKHDLDLYLKDADLVPDGQNYDLEASAQMIDILQLSEQQAYSSSAKEVDVPHLVKALLSLPDSWAAFLLRKHVAIDEANFLDVLIDFYYTPDTADGGGGDEPAESWRGFVVCVNDLLKEHNPLIGRERELDRTIQVLCRKEKNNPLHVGEPGVGKTALVYGLAQRIADGRVPPRLEKARIYSLDLGGLLAGAQFRGDFEKRIKEIMNGILKEGNAIVYIDEIHNLIGAGRTGDGSMDASNMLKPYLEGGEIRFIGSTTYQEYNRYFAKSKGIVRRFQQIDVLEPSPDETVQILEGLRSKYEDFHNVTYADGVMEYAVEMSAKFINDRFLPDKAIDLIDESGAYLEMHPVEGVERQVVNKELVSDVLARVCKVDSMALHAEDDNAALEKLEERIASQIYGQPEAVRQVVEAVQMGKAGLLEDGKPVASLLFVGPTGVGKTEVTRVLAKELGLELVRFDMSEYTEKHTVAKLIGSPAGYVGYEDGGLLTDAIRKTPHCVLLLDEIEKAHSDIYNVLLQVMDYARLTDNKGQKADFRNVILVMTSNAGAQYASQASVGFASKVTAGEAMLAQVKKTFKPEFLNRLSGTVVFNDMDRTMAELILDKKIRQLAERLESRKVSMELTDAARGFLLEKGFVPQYGAREMDRVIRQQLNPLLMREILFGSLKKGGTVRIGLADGRLAVLGCAS
ncbi:MAG: AAA family ATPase [Paludibacteraceae bacterium]|nr:AAA family ATPase [Paludibacteraceae bacterium]